MKKKLDDTTIVNELRGQSAFFPPRPAEKSNQEQEADTVIPRHHETVVSTMQPRCNVALDSKLNAMSLIEEVR